MFAYQLFTGLLIGFQAVYFFQRESGQRAGWSVSEPAEAGMDTSKSFALGLGNNAIQTVAVGFSWVLGSYCGRRTIYLWGVGFNAVACLLIGITASLPKTSATLYAQAAFVILSYTMYGLTIGPVTYTIISETSSVRLRAQSIALARASYYVSVIWAIVRQYPTSRGELTARLTASHVVHAQPGRAQPAGAVRLRLARHVCVLLDHGVLLPPGMQGQDVPRAGRAVPPRCAR